ncbi:hypothetical protein EV174_005253 [Coemansia sp. RSA 2320]|nr:hypothetical protein EV174_005253 [Coemansia sp. RSA 2320]
MSALEEESLKRKAYLLEKFSALRKNTNDKAGSSTLPTQTVEASVSGVVEQALTLQREQAEKVELDIAAIAPKRANWDLKQDLQKRLDALKPQNEAAIADLVRKRIQESKNTDDLASAVEAHAQSTEAQFRIGSTGK